MKQQRCALLRGVDAVGTRAVYSENLAQSVGEDLIKWLMGLFSALHASTGVCLF